jgi:hypothetical protein
MPVRASFLLLFFAGGSAMNAFAGSITYSGIQNIVLQGIPGSNQTLDIELAGLASPTDIFELEITDFPSFSDPYGGANGVIPGLAEVALAFGTYPRADPLSFGTPYPSNPQFGSGSIVLYGFGFGPNDGDFYYPLESETSNLVGWAQLLIQNSNTSNESITVVDWAFTDVPGQTLAMGQVSSSVPEPATWLLTGSALAFGFLVHLSRGGCNLGLGWVPSRLPTFHS